MELILLLLVVTRGTYFLNNLEHRYDVSFLGLAELCNEEDGCGQNSFSCIVEVCVLTEGASMCPAKGRYAEYLA